MANLFEKKCVPCEGGVTPLTLNDAEKLLSQLRGWEISNSAKEIFKDFTFTNFYKTMSFVNAVAWVANQENHHPDLTLGYNYCRVKYSTHAINGLSENDFICAAKIDHLST